MFHSEFQLVPLLSEIGQLMMRHEGGRSKLESLLPTLDSRRQRTIDILECLLRRDSRRRVAARAHPVEHAASFDLHPGLMTEKRELQRDVKIGRIEPHSFGKLIAGGVIFTNLKVGISEVIADGGGRW